MNLPNQSIPVTRNEFGPVLNALSNEGINPNACVGLSVNSQGRVCVGLPIIGTRCIPINTPLPRGTAVRACITTKTIFGIPSGVCVKLTALGRTVANPCFGL
jgi:hypothetical protein